MSVTNRGVIQRILFILAASIVLFVALTNVGGVLIFGGMPSHIGDLFYVYYPLVAFPLSIIPFFFPKPGVTIFSLYVIGNWVFEFVISLPQLAINPFNSLSNSALIVAALLFGFGLFFHGSVKSEAI